MSIERVPCSRKKVRDDVIQILQNPKFENIFSEIETCQNLIDVLSDEEVNEKVALSRKYDSLKKTHFVKRSKLIERIPNFWITAIENHPELSLLVDEDDEVRNIFRYVTKIDINLLKAGHLQIKVFFQENPYIANQVLTKEFTVGENEDETSKRTKIIWKKNLKPEQDKPSTSCKRRISIEPNFFDWFAEENAIDDNTSTSFYEIWEAPMACYTLGQIDDSEEEEMNQSEDDEEDY